MTVRVLVADDHAAIRAGLAMMLDADPGIEIVGEVADGLSAVRRARELNPDVVLMDVRMPQSNGIDATRTLVADGTCEVLVLTAFDLDEHVYDALRAGASGFLLKSVQSPRLCEAVHHVAAGEAILDPAITRRLLTTFADSAPPTRQPAALERLTGRERDVLACLGAGMTNQQIAHRLHISETTVKTHVSRVLAKLDLRSRVQAAIVASEHGLT